MIDGLPPETKNGALGGLVLLGIMILRWIGLRASKDAITLKADSSDRDAFDRLQKRVEQMDARIEELESARSHLFGFITKCMAYISQCQCEGINPPTKDELQRDYYALIKELTERFGGKKTDHEK